MSDAEVTSLATGRDDILREILDTVDASRRGSGPPQHLMLIGPCGMGKSFLLRMVQVASQEVSPAPLFVLLPEEQPNIATPSGFLDEIRRILEGGTADLGMAQWNDAGPEAWNASAEALGAAIAERTPVGERPLLVASVENFDVLLDRVFAEKAEQSRLRKLLASRADLMLLVTTLKGDLDQAYDERMFHAIRHLRLAPWGQEDYLAYFRKRRGRAALNVSDPTEAKIRAISTFTGGSPRMAVVLTDLLEENDPLSAAETLDRLVDELTPYYQDLLDRIPPRSRSLFDALIRGGEPCSQSDLAARVGTTQNRIAQHFAWLREHEVLFGERRKGGREMLYRVADRVLVQYYRKRFILHGAGYTPLAGMVEFLKLFFTIDEAKNHALDLANKRSSREAAIFLRIALENEYPRLARWIEGANDERLIRPLALMSSGTDEEALVHLNGLLRVTHDGGDRHGEALLQSQIGWSQENLGRREEALEAHRKSLVLWQQQGDAALQASNLLGVGWNLLQLRRHDESLDAFREALALCRQLGDTALQASSLICIGRNLEALGRHEEALTAHREALALDRRQGDTALQAWSLSWIGSNLRKLERHEEALGAHREALAIWQEQGNVDQQAWNLGRIGLSLEKLGQHEEALAAHREALAISQEQGNLDQQAWNLDRVGWNLEERGRREEALAAHREALAIWQEQGDMDEQAWNLGYIGWTLEKLERYEEALDAHREALAIWQQQGDMALQAWNLDRVGLSLEKLARHEEALAAHREALAIWQQQGDTALQAWNLGWIGWNLRRLGRYEEGVDAHREALAFGRQQGDVGEQAWSLRGIGWSLEDLGRYDEALDAHREALALWRQQGDTARQAEDTGWIAILLLTEARGDEAWQLLRQAGRELGDDRYTTVRMVTTAIKRVEQRGGRASAFALARELLDHLTAEPAFYAPRPTLEALIVGMLQDETPAPLVRDILAEARGLFPADGEAVIRAGELAIAYLEADRDDAVLQTVDPDLATAARTIVARLEQG